jgi:hypothetical protein
VQTYRSLNDHIDQAQARADDAFTNFEAASKELQSSREQKKLGGIPDRRASSKCWVSTANTDPLTEPFGFPLLFPEDMDPLLARVLNSNS